MSCIDSIAFLANPDPIRKVIDVGCAELIISGKVKVKQGVEIDHLTDSTVVFTDGSELEADAIILA